MKLSRNNFIVVTFLLALASMMLPYLLGLGGGNVFVKDFYAKRIMTFVCIPALLVLILTTLHQKKKISNSITFYSFLYLFILAWSFFQGNDWKILLTDMLIMSLPIIYFFVADLINKKKSGAFNKGIILILFISILMTAFNLKLQFSYLSLIAIVYFTFIRKFSYSYFLLLPLLLISLYHSLIGKNALLMLVFLVFYFYFFKNNFISISRKVFILTLTFIGALSFVVFFPEYLLENQSFKHFNYFLRHADFQNMSFKDASTGNRIFEAQKVMSIFRESSILERILGHGMGASIDLSETMDLTIGSANADLTQVHHIHMGPFAVIHRYGILGLIVYVVFLVKVLLKSISISRKTNELYVFLLGLYVIIICYDSVVTFSHMMSNFLFWFGAAIILSYKHNYDEKLLSQDVV